MSTTDFRVKNGIVVGGNANISANLLAGNISATTLTGNLVTALQPNITQVGTLSSLAVTGNISAGNVSATALTGNLVTAAQPNVTSLGTLTGLTLSGNLNMGSKNITAIAEPVNPQDAATQNYVDATSQGLTVKASVQLATAAALPSYVYDNGTSGVGATITASANGALTLDGTAVTLNMRVLAKNETSSNAAYNGIYSVTAVGSSSAKFVLTRTLDLNDPAEFPGAFTFVSAGSTLANTGWVCSNSSNPTIGTTS
jgi:hypothetical protein